MPKPSVLSEIVPQAGSWVFLPARKLTTPKPGANTDVMFQTAFGICRRDELGNAGPEVIGTGPLVIVTHPDVLVTEEPDGTVVIEGAVIKVGVRGGLRIRAKKTDKKAAPKKTKPKPAAKGAA